MSSHRADTGAPIGGLEEGRAGPPPACDVGLDPSPPHIQEWGGSATTEGNGANLLSIVGQLETRRRAIRCTDTCSSSPVVPDFLF